MSDYYIFNLNEDGAYVETEAVPSESIAHWLRTECQAGRPHVKMVKSNGQCTELILRETESGREWDVVDRCIEELVLVERKSFNDFRKNKTDTKVEDSKKDKPLDQKKHHLKAVRGTGRKNPNYIPMYRQMAQNDRLSTADNVLKNAKSASSGAWKLSRRQVLELGAKYKFNIPNAREKTKHLGSTGILMWRKNRKAYYLVKFSKHHKDSV